MVRERDRARQMASTVKYIQFIQDTIVNHIALVASLLNQEKREQNNQYLLQEKDTSDH